ncbi:MAG TPA: hypothetical protein VF950_14665 [Planctomycetota bacterium]
MGDFSQAIQVPSAAAEYAHVRATACACGGPFAGRGQTLLQDPVTGKRYDEIDAVCAKCGAGRKFLFDIGGFFGGTKPRYEYGCTVLAWLIAAAIGAGGYLGWRAGSTVVAILAVAAVLFLLWIGWPRPIVAPSTPPPGRDSDHDMMGALERLGIPLEFGSTDPKDAMIGGAAKAGIYVNVKALEARRWDDAARGLSATLGTLSDPKWSKVRSVALRLRALAHEGAGRKAEALADYDAALALAPDDAEARAGRTRLSG